MIIHRIFTRRYWSQCNRFSALELSAIRRCYSTPAAQTFSETLSRDLHGWTHPDLFEKTPSYVHRQDCFDKRTRHLLFNAINPFLPPDLDNELPEYFNLGHHLFYFPTPNDPQSLLPDGTERRFLPGVGYIWQYRLWAGGTIKLNAPVSPRYDNVKQYEMLEEVTDMRVVGKYVPEKVFMTITKYVGPSQSSTAQNQETEEQVLSRLKEPEYSNDSTGSQGTPRGSAVLETQNLCFLRGRPVFDSQKIISPPLAAQFSFTTIPTRWLLFTWSALTQNAHLIHLDTGYARAEYGVRNLLVQGPMTIVLMMEFLRRILQRLKEKDGPGSFALRSVQYRNIAPLFVDEEMTFCCSPARRSKDDPTIRKWDVWIQTGHSASLRLAVRATVEVSEHE